jgi:uncharacterized protein
MVGAVTPVEHVSDHGIELDPRSPDGRGGRRFFGLRFGRSVGDVAGGLPMAMADADLARIDPDARGAAMSVGGAAGAYEDPEGEDPEHRAEHGAWAAAVDDDGAADGVAETAGAVDGPVADAGHAAAEVEARRFRAAPYAHTVGATHPPADGGSITLGGAAAEPAAIAAVPAPATFTVQPFVIDVAPVPVPSTRRTAEPWTPVHRPDWSAADDFAAPVVPLPVPQFAIPEPPELEPPWAHDPQPDPLDAGAWADDDLGADQPACVDAVVADAGDPSPWAPPPAGDRAEDPPPVDVGRAGELLGDEVEATVELRGDEAEDAVEVVGDEVEGMVEADAGFEAPLWWLAASSVEVVGLVDATDAWTDDEDDDVPTPTRGSVPLLQRHEQREASVHADVFSITSRAWTSEVIAEDDDDLDGTMAEVVHLPFATPTDDHHETDDRDEADDHDETLEAEAEVADADADAHVVPSVTQLVPSTDDAPTRRERLLAVLDDLAGEIPGVRGSLVAAADGLPMVATLPADEVPRVAAVTAMVVGLSQRTLDQIGLGGFEETVIGGDEGVLVVYDTGAGAALAVAVAPDVNLGLVHLEARRAARRLAVVLTEGRAAPDGKEG